MCSIHDDEYLEEVETLARDVLLAIVGGPVGAQSQPLVPSSLALSSFFIAERFCQERLARRATARAKRKGQP